MKLLYLISILYILTILPSTGVKANYVVTSTYTDTAHSYFTASLHYSGQQPYYINQSNIMIQTLNFTYFFATPGHLIIRITDNSTQRWEIPYADPFPRVDVTKKFAPYDNANLQVTVTENPFSFKVIRKNTSEVILDSSVGDFIYSDYYLQWSTSLATPNIYGLGERAGKFNLGPDGTYTLFTKDNPADLEDGTPGNNIYGYHPVYLQREKHNLFNMVLLRTSSPMDVKIEGGQKLTYKVVSGVIDLNVFVGDNTSDPRPETVVKQYHQYLKGWTLQPFWSFGFHQCRWGYHSISDLRAVLNGYASNNLPLDVIWTDIDYLANAIDFTVDETNFPPDQMREMLSNYSKRWIPIIDAAIGLNNDIHSIGLNNNAYIHDPNGTNLVGTAAPGNVNYPDFFNPNASMFWAVGLSKLHELIPFSGIWTDMNEAYSGAWGEVDWTPNNTDLANNPPYVPNKPGEKIYTKTMRMDAVHYRGTLELHAHNMYGFLQSKATFNYLKTLEDLVFILTRSTFYGSGRFSAHWTGDNVASYDFLKASLAAIMHFNLFGVPMTGSDICGFNDDTTVELCSRWFQLGAFYPFARDHNMPNTIPQEPYALGSTVLETARASLNLRYSLLRHYYTQFLMQAGYGTIFRPVFFEYPTDENFYSSNHNFTESQFLIGQGLMVSPALDKGIDHVNVYFPKDDWFDFNTGELVVASQQAAVNMSYPAPFNATAPVFIRGGHIVPSQNVTKVRRSDDLDNQYVLNIAYKSVGSSKTMFHAEGQLVGINNFDSDNVYKKCRLGNCLYNVSADIVVSSGVYQVAITFIAQGSYQNYETVQITGLTLMGDWDTELINVIHSTSDIFSNMETDVDVRITRERTVHYTFASPFAVINGAIINISIPSLIEI